MAPVDSLLALVANLAWAFNFIAGKVGVSHFPPLLFTGLRFLILLLVLLPWLRPVPDRVGALVQIGLTLGVAHFALMFLGLSASADVSSVAIAGQLYVPFSALLAVLWLGERLDAKRLIGIATAFAGVLVIGFDPIVFQHLDALAYIVGASVMMALATVQMRRIQGVGVFTLQAWVALLGAPGQLLLSAWLEQGQWAAIASASWLEWAAPAYSAIGSSLVGHGLVYYLLRRYPVSVTAPLMLLTPVLAVTLGVVVWGDRLTWKLLLGGFLTLAGVAALTVRLGALARVWARGRR
ncbi:MAG TPA: EamA family transporter [Candidatus Competibacteraceae bacterium]|nr:EamA family transporter [Candidatus Competibacteraceae bacterium]